MRLGVDHIFHIQAAITHQQLVDWHRVRIEALQVTELEKSELISEHDSPLRMEE